MMFIDQEFIEFIEEVQKELNLMVETCNELSPFPERSEIMAMAEAITRRVVQERLDPEDEFQITVNFKYRRSGWFNRWGNIDLLITHDTTVAL